MSSAAELGISEQEFQDAMNLEKIYALVNRSSGRCSKCSNSSTHVDCSTCQWLCPSHAVGRGNCKKIGDDRFSTFEVEKLERKYGGGSRNGGGNGSPRVVKSSRSDRHRKSRRSKHTGRHSRRHRTPSTEGNSLSESDESENDYQPVKRSKSVRPTKSQQSFATAFDDDFSSPNANSFISTPSMPGMAGILQQQQQNGFSTTMSPNGINHHSMFPNAMGLNPMNLNQSGLMGSMGGMNSMGQMGSMMGQRPPSMMFGSQMGQVQHPALYGQSNNTMMNMMNQQRPLGGSHMGMSGGGGMMGGAGGGMMGGAGGGMMNGAGGGVMSGGGNPFGGGHNQFGRQMSGNQFGSQAGGFGQRPFSNGMVGGFGMQQQKPIPFISSGGTNSNMGGMTMGHGGMGLNSTYGGMGVTPQYPFRPQQQSGFGGATQQQNPFMSSGGNPMQRSYSNPQMFSSVSSIPNVSGGQRDWWD